MSVLAIGSVAFDSIETPYGTAPRVLGGSAPYITLASRYFCSEVGLVAVVGSDFPSSYVDVLRNGGVDLEGMIVDPLGLTFAWEGRYHANMNDRDTLATHLNVLSTFDPVVPERWRDARIVCLGNLDPTTQMRVIDQVRRPEMVIADTMNFWIESTPDSLEILLTRIDCLIINDSEARQLSGEMNLIRAARCIQERGPRILVIKKGEHGAMLFCDGVVFSAPAFPLETIVDPTGAGDTFAGGFAGALAREEVLDLDALKRAVVYGSTLASFSVERFGTERLLNLSQDEIAARVEAFRQLSAIPELVPVARP